jgi:hypothetical protein
MANVVFRLLPTDRIEPSALHKSIAERRRLATPKRPVEKILIGRKKPGDAPELPGLI